MEKITKVKDINITKLNNAEYRTFMARYGNLLAGGGGDSESPDEISFDPNDPLGIPQELRTAFATDFALLTDAVNNRGEIAPVMAAEIAKEQGIRVYTIGVGSRGTAPTPAIDMFGNMTFVQAKVEIDEKTLQEIADATGGRYFRATDNEKLRAIYDEINRLEKSKVEVADFTTYTEEYLRWVLAALALLAAEFLIRTLILKRIP